MREKYGPRGRRKHGHPFHKGDLKYIMLDLIKDKSCYGYELMQILEERSHGFYSPSPGTIYPTLQLLEELGYLNAVQQDSKKIYSITEAGIKFLSEQNDLAEGIKKQMDHFWDSDNRDDMAEMMDVFHELRHLLGQEARRADSSKLGRIQAVISKAYGDIKEILK
jgi:DNA-binding PadR family transcriptional regulator